MNAFQRARNLADTPLIDAVTRKVPHNADKTLVIIDMQDGFMSEDETVIVPAICSLIRHAKYQEWAIIVVEFDGYGKTDRAILEILVGYPHWTPVYKGNSDGGKEVIECIKNHPSWSMDLLVCGIYGPECVAETVCGLFDESDLVEVTVVTDAVYPSYCSCTEELSDGILQEREVEVEDIVGCKSIAFP